MYNRTSAHVYALMLFVRLTFAVASLLTGARARVGVIVDRLLVILHDEVWRKLSERGGGGVLRRRKRRIG